MSLDAASQPFTDAERHADRLDALEEIWSALVEHRISAPADVAVLGAEYARVEKLLKVYGARVRPPVPDAPATPEVPTCVRGLHPLTEENTIRTPIPELKCRACRRLPLPPAGPQDWPSSEPSDWN